MTVRKAAMVGCDGGKSSARAAAGVLDQRCRIPPPAGSQGCRLKPSGGRSRGFADVGLALRALGGRAALAVQAQPRQQAMTQGGQTCAAAAAIQPRTAARTRPVNLRYEAGTLFSESGAVVCCVQETAAQHVIPDVGGDANDVLKNVIPPSLRSGVAGRPEAMAGCSPAPVWTTVARASASVGSTAGEDRSGPPRSIPMKIGAGHIQSRAAERVMSPRRHAPRCRQSCHPQPSQKFSPPGAILGRPLPVGFSQPSRDLRGITVLQLGDLPEGVALFEMKPEGLSPVVALRQPEGDIYQSRRTPNPTTRDREDEPGRESANSITDHPSKYADPRHAALSACIAAPQQRTPLFEGRAGPTVKVGHINTRQPDGFESGLWRLAGMDRRDHRDRRSDLEWRQGLQSSSPSERTSDHWRNSAQRNGRPDHGPLQRGGTPHSLRTDDCLHTSVQASNQCYAGDYGRPDVWNIGLAFAAGHSSHEKNEGRPQCSRGPLLCFGLQQQSAAGSHTHSQGRHQTRPSKAKTASVSSLRSSPPLRSIQMVTARAATPAIMPIQPIMP